MASNSSIPGQCPTATRIGFFVEYLIPYYPTAKHCGVADMVGVALKLSAAGAGDYWDDADRWVRNHFIENQMTSAEWVSKFKTDRPPPPAADESVDRVNRRNVGTFFGWPSANDGCPLGAGHVHCCAGNGRADPVLHLGSDPRLPGRLLDCQPAHEPHLGLGRRGELHPLHRPRRSENRETAQASQAPARNGWPAAVLI